MIYQNQLLLQEDNYYPHPMIQKLMWDALNTFSEPLFTRWPLNKLRENALKITMDHIHYEDENSRYITIGCVEKVRNCIMDIVLRTFVYHIFIFIMRILAYSYGAATLYACLLG